MNATNLTVNTVGKSRRELAFEDVYFSILYLIGMTSVCVNLSVLTNAKLKEPTYKYLMVEALADLFYLMILAIFLIFNCGESCASYRNFDFFYEMFALVFVDYMSSCLSFNNTLIELLLSLQRLYIMRNRTFMEHLKVENVSLLIMIVSLVYFTPMLFLKNSLVYLEQGQIKYAMVTSEFSRTLIGRILPAVSVSVRIFLATFALAIINFITLSKFKLQLDKKSALQISSSSK